MGRTVYRASRARVAFLVLVCGTLALVFAMPWLGDYLRDAALAGRWQFIRGFGVEELVLVGYVAAVLFAVSALGLGRFLVDNRVVVLDGEGITVRHPFGAERGYWDEFKDAKSDGRGPNRTSYLRFAGEHGHRKVYFPSRILGVNLKAIGDELVSRMELPSIHRETRARVERAVALDPPPERPIDPVIGLGRRPVFGRLAAAEPMEVEDSQLG